MVAPATSPDTTVKQAKGFWTLATTVLGGNAGVLTLGPPHEVPALTIALTTAAAGLAYASGRGAATALRRRAVEKRRWPQRAAYLLAALLLLGSGLLYVIFRADRTVPYAGERRIIGTELTEQGVRYAAGLNRTNAELLMDAAGVAEHVWTTDSLRWSTILLWSTFLLLVVVVLFTVVFSIFATSDPPAAQPAVPPPGYTP